VPRRPLGSPRGIRVLTWGRDADTEATVNRLHHRMRYRLRRRGVGGFSFGRHAATGRTARDFNRRRRAVPGDEASIVAQGGQSLSDDEPLQAAVLTVHHCYIQTSAANNVTRITENHQGLAAEPDFTVLQRLFRPFYLPQRAAAAFRAASFRSSAVMPAARFLPPFAPPSLPRATAAAFFSGGTILGSSPLIWAKTDCAAWKGSDGGCLRKRLGIP
jgi:hypothetical protein